MNRFESERDRRGWEQILERLDLSAGDLATAERQLAAAQPRALSEAWVETTVGRATADRTRMVPALISRRRWLRHVSWAAAVLVVGLLGFVVVRLLWPEQARSRFTMTYPVAIELLERSDATAPLSSRRSAMAQVQGIVVHAIGALRRTRDDAQEPPALSAECDQLIQTLRVLVTLDPAPQPAPVDDGLLGTIQEALDAGAAQEVRIAALRRVSGLAASGLLALRRAPDLPPAAQSDQAHWLQVIARELAR